MPVSIRPLRPDDPIADITDLLHRAYAALATQGFRFWASHQDEAATRKRFSEGHGYVAERDGKVVGTITLKTKESTKGSPWYDRPDVASFGQFGVEPALQGNGIGGELLRTVEQRAIREGVAELALDTAEGATRLIDLYSKRGYRFIEYVDWRPDTNYRSVILSKTLRR
jgi:GNAT superfamily N-acetyltransferase